LLKRLYTRETRFGYYKGDYIGQPKPKRSDASGYYTIKSTVEMQFETVDRYVYWRLRWRYYVEHRKRLSGMNDFPQDLSRDKGLYRLRGRLRKFGTEN